MEQDKKDRREYSPCYFVTLNIVDWVDVFIRPVYKQIIVHSLNHFTEHKGLTVYAWCLMTNHLHLVAGAREGYSFPEIEKEFKIFTTQKILEAMAVEPAKRRKWMLARFENFSNAFGILKKFQLWQTCTNPVHISLNKSQQLIEFVGHIHSNPVRDRIVGSAEDYLYSSAKDYAGMKGLVEITKLPIIVQQFNIAENVHGDFSGKFIRN